MQIIKTEKELRYKTIKASELNSGDWFEYDGELKYVIHRYSDEMTIFSLNIQWPECLMHYNIECIDHEFSDPIYPCDAKIIYERVLL